jgi:hypothetical protein
VAPSVFRPQRVATFEGVNKDSFVEVYSVCSSHPTRVSWWPYTLALHDVGVNSYIEDDEQEDCRHHPNFVYRANDVDVLSHEQLVIPASTNGPMYPLLERA